QEVTPAATLIAADLQPLYEARSTDDVPGEAALGIGEWARAGLPHCRRYLRIQPGDVLEIGRAGDQRRSAGELSLLTGIELAAVSGDALVELVGPAESHVEQQPLVEEAAVELGTDVERVVLGREIEDVERGAGIGSGVGRVACLEEAGRAEWVSPAPAAGSGRAGHRHAQAVVAGDEEGQLPDEVDGLLGPEPTAVSSLDGVVDGLARRGVGDEVAAAVDLGLLVVAGVGVPLLGILDAGEEPQLVLDDVAAQGGAEVPDVVEIEIGRA